MTVINEEGQDIEEVVPNFWPLPLYNIHFEGEAHVDMVRELKFKGKVIKGIYVEDDGRPLPAGVLKVKNFDKSSVNTSQVVEDSSSQFAEGQAERTKRALSARFNSEASASATAEITKRAALTPLPKEEAEQEDAPGKKRKTGKSGTEEEENEAGDGFNFLRLGFSTGGKHGHHRVCAEGDSEE